MEVWVAVGAGLDVVGAGLDVGFAVGFALGVAFGVGFSGLGPEDAISPIVNDVAFDDLVVDLHLVEKWLQ